MHQDDRLFWVTDLGWIMGPWEITGALAAGGTVVLAEGAPDYPAPDRIWSMVERHGVTILGVSPTLVRALMRHGDEPVVSHDLSRPAGAGVDGRGVGPGVLAVVIRESGRQAVPDHQSFRWNRGWCLPAFGASDHAAETMLAGGAGACDGCRRL